MDFIKRKWKTLLFTAICVLLAFSAAVNVIAFLKLDDKTEELDKCKEVLNDTGDSLSLSLEEAKELKNKIETLDGEIEENKKTISSLEKNKEEIGKEFSERIEELEKTVKDKEEERKELQKRLAELEEVTSVDINAQLEILNDLEYLLSHPPKRIYTEKTDTGEKDAQGGIIYREEQKEEDASVALYYYDLINENSYSFNGDRDFSSASLVKLPYALTLLKAASEDKKEHEGEENYVPLGLDTVFVYDSTKKVEGSGTIQYRPDGSRFTYLELVDYMIKDSDNVAFKKLREVYGTSYIMKYATESRFDAMRRNFYHMTAKDAGEVMKDVYHFVKTDVNYGGFLRSSLEKAGHTVMVAGALRPKIALHKYGWDEKAYHDAALVCDDRPFIIVFMSDLEQGGSEVNSYIREVTLKIKELHDNLKKKKKST